MAFLANGKNRKKTFVAHHIPANSQNNDVVRSIVDSACGLSFTVVSQL